MDYKDYYKVMGVARDATQDDIKRAYRKLARKYHPDVSKDPQAETRFKDLGEAYEVLKDPEKRAAYDQLGSDWRGGQEFRPPPGWDAGFEYSGGGERDFSDFFETLFGQGRGRAGGGPRRQRYGMRGQDHHARVFIDLEDSFRGGMRAITLQVPEVTRDGHVTTRERTLQVRIPKGVRAGQQIRLTGQGAPGMGDGRAGDLYLEVQFNPHPLYRIEGTDIHLELPVAPWEAALGAAVQAPTPGGEVELKIPANSQQGRRMRLKGRGLSSTPPGDLYVTLKVVFPPAEGARARALYEQMRNELDFDPRAGFGTGGNSR